MACDCESKIQVRRTTLRIDADAGVHVDVGVDAVGCGRGCVGCGRGRGLLMKKESQNMMGRWIDSWMLGEGQQIMDGWMDGWMDGGAC